jgi:signal peptidase I
MFGVASVPKATGMSMYDGRMEVAPLPPPLSAAPKRLRKRRRGLIREVLETVIVVLIVYFGFRSVALPYEVNGASMTPYLHEGERLFVSRVSYAHVDTNDLWNLLPWEDRDSSNEVYLFDPPKRGDIVVLNPPYASDEPYIKRVIGLPGETITFANGAVLVNGEPLHEDYIEAWITSCSGGEWCSLVVPEGSVFVLGDNRQDSTDSRDFGPIRYDRIIGKAVFANWPIEQFGRIDRPDYEP